MRIVILTQYFPPEPAIKLSAIVRHLVAAGHEVQVLTSLPNLPQGKLYAGYKYAFIQREELLGATILRTFVWPYRGRSTWKRVVHLASFALSASLCCWRLKRFDLLYVYHPPLTISIPALITTKIFRAPMLYDVQDIWPEAGLAAGAIKQGILYSIMSKIARFVYDCASHITVIAPEFKDLIAQQGIVSRKISVIPNWTDEDCFEPKIPTGVRSRYGLPEDAFIVMYAGNFGSSHGVGTLVEAAQLLRNESRIVFALSGSGAEYDRTCKTCESLALPNVILLGYIQQRSELPYLYSCADVMLVHIRRSPSGAVSLPSRILAYMACARPILACCEGAPRRLIETACCGMGCEPESPERMAALIVKAMRSRAILQELGTNGCRYYREHFSETETMEKLMALMESLVPPSCRTKAYAPLVKN
jgi:glycosyltransferase involved in cell wall biosynthesis